ncbi:hypothetical protein Tco_1315296 [Tanacetum coccineum]
MGRDTIQLEGAVSTISGEYLLEFTTEYGIHLLEFTTEYGILENLHSDVPGLGETIVDFPEGKVGSEAEEHVQEGLAHEIPHVETATTTEVVQEALHEEEVAATEPPVNKRRKQMRRKRVNEEAKANAPPKVLRKSHASSPAHSTRGGKSLAAMGLDAGSTFSPPAAQNTPTAVSDPEPLSYAKPQPHPVQDIAQIIPLAPLPVTCTKTRSLDTDGISKKRTKTKQTKTKRKIGKAGKTKSRKAQSL